MLQSSRTRCCMTRQDAAGLGQYAARLGQYAAGLGQYAAVEKDKILHD